MQNYLLSLIIAICCLTANNARSHIEHGGMPDSVAEMEYRILLEFEPLKHDVRNKLGNVLFRLKKYEEAKEEFLMVLAKEPDDLQAQIGLGQILMHEEKWSEAENQFLKLQKNNSENVELYYQLGTLYRKTGRIKEAENTLMVGILKGQTDQSEESVHLLGKINEILADIRNQGEMPLSKSPQ